MKTEEIIDNRKNFKLKRFVLEFEKGYSFKDFPEQKIDRYEGYVEFENGFNEKFTLKSDIKISEEIINIISEKLAENTDILIKNIKECLK